MWQWNTAPYLQQDNVDIPWHKVGGVGRGWCGREGAQEGAWGSSEPLCGCALYNVNDALCILELNIRRRCRDAEQGAKAADVCAHAASRSSTP